jgi:predicted ATP-dependent serine protease
MFETGAGNGSKTTNQSQSASSPTDPGGLQFQTLSALFAEAERQVEEWLVEGRLPIAGVSILAGKPKAGKSTLARCLAFSVARGTPWLGFKTNPGVVLYLALEEKRSEIGKHFKAMGATETDPIFVFAGGVPKDGIDRLREEIQKTSPRLIIIDPLLKLVRVSDANDYARVSAALEPLMALARDSKAHVMAVHHVGKGDRVGTDSILGSTAFSAAVDTILVMRRLEGCRTLASTQRYGEDLEEITLAYVPSQRTIIPGISREAAEQNQAAGRICEFLESQSEPVPEQVILDGVDGRKFMIQRALRQLFKDEVLVRVGRGNKGSPFLYSLRSAAHAADNVSTSANLSPSPEVSASRIQTLGDASWWRSQEEFSQRLVDGADGGNRTGGDRITSEWVGGHGQE